MNLIRFLGGPLFCIIIIILKKTSYLVFLLKPTIFGFATFISSAYSELPAFLTQDGGLNSGFMIAHCTAAALGRQNLYCKVFDDFLYVWSYIIETSTCTPEIILHFIIFKKCLSDVTYYFCQHCVLRLVFDFFSNNTE